MRLYALPPDPFLPLTAGPTLRLECCVCGSHVKVSANAEDRTDDRCPICHSVHLQPLAVPRCA
jgi:hypothetical protein